MTRDLSSNLGIQHTTPPDGNPYNPDRIQTSDSARSTERAAEQLITHGLPIPAPPMVKTLNGQYVDMRFNLMCSKCKQWKQDKQFRKDKTRIIRRGRAYYCRTCQSKYGNNI